MEKESYADFSIIYKYHELKKIYTDETARLNAQIQELKDQLAQANAKIQQLQRTIEQLTKERHNLQLMLTDATKRIDKLTKDNAVLRDENLMLKQENDQMRAALEPKKK